MNAQTHHRIELALAVVFALVFAAGTYFLFKNFPGYTGTVGNVPLIVVVLVATIIGALVGSRIAFGQLRRHITRGDGGGALQNQDGSGISGDRNLGALLINWGVVAGLVGGAAAGTFEFTASQFENQLETMRSQLELRTDEVSEREQELADLQRNFEELVSDTQRVSLLRPEPQATAIGTNGTVLEFDWTSPDERSNQRYIVEIRDIRSQNGHVRIFDYLKMDGTPMRIPASVLNDGVEASAEFIWRVRPGRVVDGKQVALGDWSRYGSFLLYPSIVDRMQNMGQVRVGFSGGFTGVFNTMQTDGTYQGFDQDFSAWLVEQLGDRLGFDTKPLAIERIEFRFKDLLDQLQAHRIDMVVSSMTRTKAREQKYGIRFSEPYLNVHQIFVSNEPLTASFPQGLRGKVVGVSPTSTNYKAAEFLQSRYGFVVRPLDGGESRRALRLGKVDFNISDNVVISGELGKSLFQYGPELTSELGNLYEDQYGFSSESYGVAIRDPELLALVDEILLSEAAQTKLAELRARWLE